MRRAECPSPKHAKISFPNKHRKRRASKGWRGKKQHPSIRSEEGETFKGEMRQTRSLKSTNNRDPVRHTLRRSPGERERSTVERCQNGQKKGDSQLKTNQETWSY